MGSFYTIKSDSIVGANGTEFFFEGLQGHTIDSLKSIERINRCWVEEAHAVTDKSWEILLPSLFRVDDFQLWITFNTRKVTDPTYIRFVQQADADMLVKKVGWQDNPWFPDGLNKQRLKLLETDPEAYKHVWDGEPDTRHNGSVYAKWVDKLYQSERCRNSLYDPDLPVNTAWDLGWSDSTSIIFWQQSGKETRIIDCYESFNESIEHYAGVIKERGYKYGKHFAPKDAGNKLLASGGRSVVEIARSHGLQLIVWPETTHMNRQEALRTILGIAYIDKLKCRDLIHALINYQFKFNEELKIFSTVPVHDWSSHYSTAAELMARVVREERAEAKETKTAPIHYRAIGGKTVGKVDIKAYISRREREE
jgi:phage terminase large subunit